MSIATEVKRKRGDVHGTAIGKPDEPTRASTGPAYRPERVDRSDDERR